MQKKEFSIMNLIKKLLVGGVVIIAPMCVVGQEYEAVMGDQYEPIASDSTDFVVDEDESTLESDSLIISSVTTISLPVDSLQNIDSLLVARYHLGWDSLRVNPYAYPIDSIKDTFVVDCRGFFPPNVNVVTSECGERWGRFHAGTDMRLKVGDSIYAAFDGKVRMAKYGHPRKGYGYYVVLQHANGLETLYGHLSKILVKVNQDVKAGDVIAYGGNTGRSTGPHLHFEFRYLGNPINTRNLLVITDSTMEMRADTYVVRPSGKNVSGSFDEFYKYKHSPAVYHKVRPGDNLGKIARRYHTTVSKLCKLNRIKSTTILRIGRRLRVR